MPRQSLETQELVKFFKQCALEHRVATYAEMKEVMFGINPQTKPGVQRVQSALRICRNDSTTPSVFKNIPGVGYEPVKDPDIPKYATTTSQKRIKSTNNVWRESLNAVDVSKLDSNSLRQHNASYFKLQLSEASISPEVNKKVEELPHEHSTGKAGLEYLKDSIRMLLDVS